MLGELPPSHLPTRHCAQATAASRRAGRTAFTRVPLPAAHSKHMASGSLPLHIMYQLSILAEHSSMLSLLFSVVLRMEALHMLDKQATSKSHPWASLVSDSATSPACCSVHFCSKIWKSCLCLLPPVLPSLLKVVK